VERHEQNEPRSIGTATGEPLLMKAEEVARLLSLGRSKVYEMMASGELPSVKIGTARRVPRAALLDWITQRTEVSV
jgi:excisionase family DNA binding protein